MRGGIRIQAKTVEQKPVKSTYKKVEASSTAVNRPTLAHNVSNPDDINIGMMVEHQRFGKGEVLQLEGQGVNKKATVKFKDGPKQLILRFARLQILN